MESFSNMPLHDRVLFLIILFIIILAIVAVVQHFYDIYIGYKEAKARLKRADELFITNISYRKRYPWELHREYQEYKIRHWNCEIRYHLAEYPKSKLKRRNLLNKTTKERLETYLKKHR